MALRCFEIFVKYKKKIIFVFNFFFFLNFMLNIVVPNLEIFTPPSSGVFLISKSSPPKGKGKGKSIPLQAWRGPEISSRLRLAHFKTIST